MSLDTPDRDPKIDKAVEIGHEVKSGSLHAFYLYCLDFKDMAQGGNGFGQRESFYSGWTDADFQTVLDEIGGEETLKAPAESGSPRFYEEILERFKNRKKNSEYYDSIYELVSMAQGGDPYNLRRSYPGWNNDDFKRLLLDLDQEDALKFDHTSG